MASRKSNASGPQLNRSELAAAHGVSLPTVDAWVRRGCPFLRRPCKGAGWLFDSAAVIAWRVAQARAELVEGDGAVADFEKERARRAAIDRRLGELELGERLGELVEVDAVARVIADEYGRVRGALISLPARVASLVARETTVGRCRQLIDAEVRGVLDELSHGDAVIAAARAARGDTPPGAGRKRPRRARAAAR